MMETTTKEASVFSPKSYPCKCHVCGREFELVTEFLSASSWLLEDGRSVSMLSCNADPNGPDHSGEEIRAAWDALVRSS